MYKKLYTNKYICGVTLAGTLYMLLVYLYSQSSMYSDYGPHQPMVLRREEVGGNSADTKYILLWTRRKCFECAPFNYMTEGRELFGDDSCPEHNCYITENRTLLGEYVNFDAVLFNGRPILRMKENTFPVNRSSHQTYVFVQLESADRFPVCNPYFEDYFNRTMTFKLDSDYPWPYLEVALTNGTAVGPRRDMKWIDYTDMKPISEGLRRDLRRKSKVAAWFVTNCGTRSGRERYVKLLQKELEKYNKTVDVYGKCGTLSCPRSREAECNKLLERDYLSFENSFDKDYATEKLLTPLQHSTVPVVYGDANYSNLLPAGSYLDARELGAAELAQRMVDLMTNQSAYEDMFRWRNHYAYRDAMRSAFCSLCVSLHRGDARVYHHFREWWYGPTYKKRCNIKV